MDQTTDNGGRILLVDDEAAILRTFRYCLEDRGYTVMTAASAAQAEAILQRQVFDLCFLDLRLGEDNGLDVLQQMRTLAPWMRVVIVTAHSAVDTAVDAMQAGAADYLLKPCSPEQLRLSAAKQLEVRQMAARLEALEGEMKQRSDALGSHSPAMMAVLETARQVADTDANILILGESGTGKELIASAIHYNSPRAHQPLVRLNCAALPETLLESELFGHEKGAFTGAVKQRKGRFEQADGGTLFLDEIGEISPMFQAKLLRVLQEGELERVGGTQTVRVNVRIVAATNRDLEHEVEQGKFREDLYYRLNVMAIRVPPLRERSADIPELAEFLIDKIARQQGRPLKLTDSALRLLMSHRWPGNVRELENCLERSAIMSEDGTISRDVVSLTGLDHDATPLTPVPEVNLADDSLDDRERVIAALEQAGWVQAKAARLLGMTPRQIAYRVQTLNIHMRKI